MTKPKPKPEPPQPDVLVTTKEAANLLHLYPKAVIRLHQRGKLVGRQLPGGRNQTYVFDLTSVLDYAATLPGFSADDLDEIEALRGLAENRPVIVSPPKRTPKRR